VYVVTVAFEIRPEAAAAFLPLMLENARASLAKEPGCLRFDVCGEDMGGQDVGGQDVGGQDVGDDAPPVRVFLYEIYRDRGAFDAHLASAHFQSFDAATRPMVASKQVASWRLLAPEREPTEPSERP